MLQVCSAWRPASTQRRNDAPRGPSGQATAPSWGAVIAGLANAGLAAQFLLDTYNKVCGCSAATCQQADEKFDCMQNVEDFAEYLDEFKISADALSLDNISLQARLLVLKLHACTTMDHPDILTEALYGVLDVEQIA